MKSSQKKMEGSILGQYVLTLIDESSIKTIMRYLHVMMAANVCKTSRKPNESIFLKRQKGPFWLNLAYFF